MLADVHHEALLEIYNHYIETSSCTFDTRPFSSDDRKTWYDQFETPYRCYVAIVGGQVVGHACAMPFRSKPAYRTSTEVSIYVSHDCHAKGIASALYERLFAYLDATDLHRAYAGITLPNDASVGLHAKFGFKQIGLYNEVGYKFGRFWDVAWFERPLAEI